jgi:5-methylcytosine-specific restriction endonuclease McrA
MPYKDPENKRKYQLARYHRLREEWLLGKTCVECGSVDRLEIDHIISSTKVTHKVWSWSVERRDLELVKCQVLCHDCHQEKTKRFDLPQPKHGAGKMYSKYGCRCIECVAFKKADNAKRKFRSVP